MTVLDWCLYGLESMRLVELLLVQMLLYLLCY